VLEDGIVADQVRFGSEDLKADPTLPVRWLEERGPFQVIAGPSGYGLPLLHVNNCSDRDLALMTLRRPDQAGSDQGVAGFSRMLRALRNSELPVIFLPGVIHLPTVPDYRKINRIDLGTADKLCVAALALALDREGFAFCNCCVVELGSAFTACLVTHHGQILDGVGGTSGPVGWQSGGAWDGEAAYLLSPLTKADLFAGGVQSLGDSPLGRQWFRESLVRTVAGLHAVTPFEQIVLSGRLLEMEPALATEIKSDLARIKRVSRLGSLPGAWVKHAAQGAALIADGLADGDWAELVEKLQLVHASGTVLDWLRYPRADELRNAWGVNP
jgi:predicted butyrate kinase (DUF1464 family)